MLAPPYASRFVFEARHLYVQCRDLQLGLGSGEALLRRARFWQYGMFDGTSGIDTFVVGRRRQGALSAATGTGHVVN